jgi:hypothetical protein
MNPEEFSDEDLKTLDDLEYVYLWVQGWLKTTISWQLWNSHTELFSLL